MWRYILLGLIFVFSSWSAQACADSQSGPMPKCSLPEIIHPDRIIGIDAEIPAIKTDLVIERKYESNQGPSTEFEVFYSEIKVGKLLEPVSIVLASYNPVVFKFEGDLDNVDQVIILGSRRVGPGGVGVLGVAEHKIQFAPLESVDNDKNTYCVAPPVSCHFQQFFEVAKPDRLGMPIDFSKYYDNRWKAAVSETGEKSVLKYLLSEDQSGLSIDYVSPTKVSDSLPMPHGSYSWFLASDTPLKTDLVVKDIVSYKGENISTGFRGFPIQDLPKYQLEWSKSDLWPGWYGMQQLQDKGVVLLPDHFDFDRRMTRFKKQESSYRTPVIAIGDIDTLPLGLNGSVQFYVVSGVEVPCKHYCKEPKYFVFENPDIETRKSKVTF